jgi:hypothetical protein
MKIIIKDDGYEFSKEFNDSHPAVEEALFAAIYLLTKVYPLSEVKNGLVEVAEDI